MTFSIEQPVVYTCDFLSNNCQLVSRAGSVGFFSVFLFFPFFFFLFLTLRRNQLYIKHIKEGNHTFSAYMSTRRPNWLGMNGLSRVRIK